MGEALTDGLLVMTLGVYGMIRMSDISTKLHAAIKSVVLGVITIAVAAMLVSDQVGAVRLILLCVPLLITTPVTSHTIDRPRGCTVSACRPPA